MIQTSRNTVEGYQTKPLRPAFESMHAKFPG